MMIGQYEELAQLAKTHVCYEHPDLELTVAWFEDGFYVLRCGAGHFPDELQKLLTPTQRYAKAEMNKEVLEKIKTLIKIARQEGPQSQEWQLDADVEEMFDIFEEAGYRKLPKEKEAKHG